MLQTGYASNKVRDEQAEAVRFDLLKSTYRLEREAQAELYAHRPKTWPEISGSTFR